MVTRRPGTARGNAAVAIPSSDAIERGRMRRLRSAAPVTPEPELPKRGPRTATGKAASKMNAVKHGLRSGVPVIPGVESFEEWEEFRDGIVASYAPEGRLETELAETCANILWRKRRIYNYETEMTAIEMCRNRKNSYQVTIAPIAGVRGRHDPTPAG